MNTGPVVVIGEIVTDIIAGVSDPIAVASETRAKITLRPGGAGGNVAAWMAELGANISLVAAIGEDASGRALQEELLARGVKPRLVRRPGSSSGSVLVLVDHVGERTMLTDAANGDLTTGDIPAGCSTSAPISTSPGMSCWIHAPGPSASRRSPVRAPPV